MSNGPKNESEIAFKVGELTGVIKEFSDGIHRKLDDMNSNINGKIGEETCKLIVNDAIKEHKKDDHKKNSRAPSKNTVISIPPGAWVWIIRVAVVLGGSGLGGLGIWTIIKQILGQ